MCGVVGGYSSKLVEMLCRIQHRGFTSCGFVTDYGMSQYAERVHLLMKVADAGIGHVRYATQDSPMQPFLYKDSWLAFNGEVAGGDTERLAAALYEGGRVDGAYSFVWMKDEKIIAGRDPNGFHPLYMAQGEDGLVVASETVADPSLDWRSVPRGSVVDLQTGGYYEFGTENRSKCCFEDVYFSHVASHGVWNRRRDLGRLIQLPSTTYGIDAIVPVPESSIAAAEALAHYRSIPLVSAIVKNRYSERTFIAEKGSEEKYTIIGDAIKDRHIVLVDDSIVRGVTMQSLVPRLKKYAKSVHVRVTFPKINYACRYGIRIEGEGCHDIPEADSVEFLDPIHFSGCKACIDGVYLSKPTLLPALERFQV